MKVLGGLFLIALAIAAIVFGPWALVWALNTLFALTIPYTLKTWAAALLLSAPFVSKVSYKK